MKYIHLIIFSLLSTSVYALDYYWVGGSGNWFDISHWATSSGGGTFHSQAPTSEDNVFFDANSFSAAGQTVTIPDGLYFAGDVSFVGVTNNPLFELMSAAELNIFGSLILADNMSFSNSGHILFRGSITDNHLDLGGHSAGKWITFAGDGAWQLDDNLEIDSLLELNQGRLTTNGNDLNTRFFDIRSNQSKTLDITNSTVTVTGSYSDRYDNDGIVDYDDIKSIYINLIGLTTISDNSRMIFTAPSPAIWFANSGDASFDEVIFESATGIAHIISYSYADREIEFNSIICQASTNFLGEYDLGDLNLTGGSIYRFQSNVTSNVNGISTNSNCSRRMIMTSSSPGQQATLQIPGNFNLDNTSARDINFQGGEITSDGGVDLGNNTGWTTINSISEDYYWIGGTGNWSDPMHWSYSSGGTPSGCIPSGNDNVFFDNNSFTGAADVVTLDNPVAFTHNMTWSGVSGNPEFISTTTERLFITGSLELDANMVYGLESDLSFVSNDTDNTIRSNGVLINESVRFSGVNAEWRFLDDIEILEGVYLNSGTLRMADHLFTFQYLDASSRNYKLWDISNAYIKLRDSSFSDTYITTNYANYTVEASGSTIEFSNESARAWFYHEGEVTNGIPNYNTIIFGTPYNTWNNNPWNITAPSPGATVDSMTFYAGGEIIGSNTINFLSLEEGHRYEFGSEEQNTTQSITEMHVGSSCQSGMTFLKASINGVQAILELASDFSYDRIAVKDIYASSGSINGTNSADMGNNTNVTISELAPRTLYWVAEGGDWYDEAHWSMTSGGPGGECVPTIIDNVIFDENSFSTDWQDVNSYNGLQKYCHDITVHNITNNPSFYGSFMIISGSIHFENAFNYDIWVTTLLGNEAETIESDDTQINRIEFSKSAPVTILENFRCYEFISQNGDVIADNITINTDQLEVLNGNSRNINFRESTININGNGSPSYLPMRFYSQNTIIEDTEHEFRFNNLTTGFYSNHDIHLGNLTFTNPQGTGYIYTYTVNDIEETYDIRAKDVFFAGNGVIRTQFTTESLTGSPGKSYTLQHNKNFNTDRLQLIGNNCIPISLKSSSASERAIINIPASGEVEINFVEIENTRAQGGADFNAGERSTDVGNSNVGWIFTDPDDFLEDGILGPDRSLCNNDELVLNAYSYSDNEIYIWNDGSMDSSITVNTPGTYSVQVAFENNCVLIDTIEIFSAIDAISMLPSTLPLCEGTELEIDGSVLIPGADYLWSTGETSPTIEIDQGGIYTLEVTVDSCVSMSETEVTEVINPGLELGDDISKCEGNEITLTSGLSSGSVTWSNGSNELEIDVLVPGNYSAELLENGCTFVDSVILTDIPIPVVDLGSDTTVCSSDNHMIGSIIDNATYTWNNGSSNANIQVTESGNYMLTVNVEGCSGTDEVNITVNENPDIDLGSDRTICDGEEALLIAESSSNIESYIWEDGLNLDEKIVTQEGTYWVEVTNNNCTSRDSVFINVNPLPELELGRDTTVCENEPHYLSPVTQGSGTLQWADGSSSSQILVGNPGYYTATLSDGICTTSDSIFIQLKSCAKFEAYIPNAFSPNNDGYNDVFEVYFSQDISIEKFDMQIYDRWGNKVFTSNNIEDYWDGRYQSSFMRSGVYTYILEVAYTDDLGPGEASINGSVTILK